MNVRRSRAAWRLSLDLAERFALRPGAVEVRWDKTYFPGGYRWGWLVSCADGPTVEQMRAARATALAIQSFMLDLGIVPGRWLSVRLGYAEVCALMAVTAAGAPLLLAVAVWSQRATGWVPEGQQ